jgi:hypothetical protein
VLSWAHHSPRRHTTNSTLPGYRPARLERMDERPAPSPVRDRQSAFERGILLALIGTASECVRRMQTLKEGGRWILADQDMSDLSRILGRMHEAILRAERIQTREEDE